MATFRLIMGHHMTETYIDARFIRLIHSSQCIFCPIGYCNDDRFLVLFIQMNKEEIGAAIVERRGTLEITQVRLAKLSGVSVHTLSNLETGKGNVTLDTLLKVAGIVGYKVRVGV